MEMSTQALQVRKKHKITVDKMPGSSGIHRELPLTTKEEIYYHVHFAEGNKEVRCGGPARALRPFSRA